jgi:septum formation protein
MLVSSLVLASSSPRRLDLLRSIGIHDVRVIPAGIDETPHQGESPSFYVKRLAQEKAMLVHQKLSDSLSPSFILAADTIITLGRRILQKAENREEALSQILLLSGRRHRVYTGLCLIPPQGSPRIRLVSRHCWGLHLSN